MEEKYSKLSVWQKRGIKRLGSWIGKWTMKNLDFVAEHHVSLLWDGVGHHDGLEVTGVDPVNRFSREYPVSENSVDLLRTIIN